jgi:hypothetical protein
MLSTEVSNFNTFLLKISSSQDGIFFSKGGGLFGREICTSLDDIKEAIDVAIILNPAFTVPGILETYAGRKFDGSRLMMDFLEIEGIDINPVMVLEKGAITVNARILPEVP